MRVFIILATTLAVTSAKLHGLAKFDEIRKNRFHMLTNDEELAEEEDQRLKDEAKEVARQNRRFREGTSRFREKLNEWDLLSSEEFEREREGLIMEVEEDDDSRAMGLIIPSDPADRFDLYSERALNALRQDRADTPTSYDARALGLISPVKNQMSCGSCAAFSATSVVETCLYKAGGLNEHVDLSEQWLLDCGKESSSNNGCNGAAPQGYHVWIAEKHNELPHEYTINYEAKETTCNASAEKFHAGAKVTGRQFSYSTSDEDMKKLIVKHGAVTSALYASDDTFKNYAGGVIDTCTSDSLNHAVTMVGYKDDYWIVKNSWGPQWGENGYFRIKMGVCGIGKIYAVTECTRDSEPVSTVPITTPPPPPPPSQVCDIAEIYGGGITGNYNLETTINGVKYPAKVNCDKSICQPRESGISNCCVYICGKTSC